MKTLRQLAESTEKRVIVHITDYETWCRFAEEAEREGYAFGDGVRLTDRDRDDFYAIGRDGTVNFIGAVGRIAVQCGSENYLCIDYREFAAKKC